MKKVIFSIIYVFAFIANSAFAEPQKTDSQSNFNQANLDQVTYCSSAGSLLTASYADHEAHLKVIKNNRTFNFYSKINSISLHGQKDKKEFQNLIREKAAQGQEVVQMKSYLIGSSDKNSVAGTLRFYQVELENGIKLGSLYHNDTNVFQGLNSHCSN